MRILLLTDVFFPRVNGVSTAVETTRRELEALGHEVTAVAPSYGRERGDRVVRVPSRRVPFDPEDRLMRRGAARRRLLRLDPSAYDLVHVHTPAVAHGLGVELRRRYSLPLVVTYHTFFEAYLHHYLPFLPAALLRTAVRRISHRQCEQADAVIVPSSALERVLGRYGVTSPVEVIPTGLRLQEFEGGDGAAFRRSLGIPAGRPVLLHVGRVAFEKNIGFLLEVTERVRRAVPDVLFVLVGEGPAEGALRRRASELGLEDNVRTVGYLDRERELLDCYRAGDLFVFASRTETQGLVLLEAMAMGLPVVATSHLGTADILDVGRGATVPADGVEPFADAVVGLLADPGERRRLACGARRYVEEEWSAARVAERTAALYERVVSGPGRCWSRG